MTLSAFLPRILSSNPPSIDEILANDTIWDPTSSDQELGIACIIVNIMQRQQKESINETNHKDQTDTYDQKAQNRGKVEGEIIRKYTTSKNIHLANAVLQTNSGEDLIERLYHLIPKPVPIQTQIYAASHKVLRQQIALPSYLDIENLPLHARLSSPTPEHLKLALMNMHDKHVFETLVFLSTSAPFKPMITSALVSIRNKHDYSYSLLQTYINLTELKSPLSHEERRLKELASPSKATDETEDYEERVSQRCANLVKQSSILEDVERAVSSKVRTPQTINAALIILCNVAIVPELRGRIAQTHLGTLLTHITIPSAAHALSKICISINPAFLPTSHRAGIVSRFAQLLNDENPLVLFESLLALTNLAQLDDASTCETFHRLQVILKAQSLMFEERVLVRRAATELVCNLLLCNPASNASFSRWDFVNALLLSEDENTARAAAGCLVASPQNAQLKQVTEALEENASSTRDALLEVVKNRPDWWSSLKIVPNGS